MSDAIESCGCESEPHQCVEADPAITMLQADLAARDAEIARLTAELAAARAVPPDVEAAILTFGCASGEGRSADALDEIRDSRAALRTTIARAISDATAATRADLAAAVHELGEMTRAYHVANKRTGLALTAKRLCDAAGGVWNVEYDSWMSQVHDVLNHLRADADGAVIDGRASQPATVGGLLATAPTVEAGVVTWRAPNPLTADSVLDWMHGDICDEFDDADDLADRMHTLGMAKRERLDELLGATWAQFVDEAGLTELHTTDGEVPDVR